MDEDLAPPFTVTASAVEQILALGGRLLIGVEPGGCCGTAYVFSLPEDDAVHPLDATHPDGPTPSVGVAVNGSVEPDDGVAVFRCGEAQVRVTPAALDVLRGATLDHGIRQRPPRFRVMRNPNTPLTCPCRRSFGAPWPGPGQPECRSYLPMPWDETFEPPAPWRRQTGWVREARTNADTVRPSPEPAPSLAQAVPPLTSAGPRSSSRPARGIRDRRPSRPGRGPG